MSGAPETAPDALLVWHELECGSYTADLEAWDRLAADTGEGAVLDLGCGTGRVALRLGSAGHEVVGVDIEPGFVAELNRRAEALDVPVQGLTGDGRDIRLKERFALVLAPMQLIQMLPGPAERLELLETMREHLLPGGRAALALVEPDVPGDDGEAPLPDVREEDGWIYSSLPVAIHDSGDTISVRRLRQTVSPGGGLTDEVDEVVICAIGSAELAAEAERAGLSLLNRLTVPATEDHVGSTVVVLEA